jgi:hypothetical protein
MRRKQEHIIKLPPQGKPALVPAPRSQRFLRDGDALIRVAIVLCIHCVASRHRSVSCRLGDVALVGHRRDTWIAEEEEQLHESHDEKHEHYRVGPAISGAEEPIHESPDGKD